MWKVAHRACRHGPITVEPSIRTAKRMVLEDQDLQTITRRCMADVRGNRMAMIFQEPMTSLNPCYTIGNQMAEILLRHRHASRREARERAVFLLEKVGITGAGSRLRQYPHQLSGGLRQRVMIAMSLMCEPALIIADEPTTALDVTIQAQILGLLASLQAEFGMGMILITHDLGVVARVADQVGVMYCGVVVETGAAGEIFAIPCTHTPRGCSPACRYRAGPVPVNIWDPFPAWCRRRSAISGAACSATAAPMHSRPAAMKPLTCSLFPAVGHSAVC